MKLSSGQQVLRESGREILGEHRLQRSLLPGAGVLMMERLSQDHLEQHPLVLTCTKHVFISPLNQVTQLLPWWKLLRKKNKEVPSVR